MSVRRLSVLLLAVIVASCASSAAEPKTLTLEQQMENPLFAERYWTELTDRMVTVVLQKDPAIADPAKERTADRIRTQALTRSQEATKARSKGLLGEFLTIREPSQGQALLQENRLYFGTTFETYPGADLRIYLSTVVDPRDAAFPDPTAIDLGKLQSPYGAQTYAIDLTPDAVKTMRTVVLWDGALGRIYGFAQLSGQGL